jgi:hypothetical protein
MSRNISMAAQGRVLLLPSTAVALGDPCLRSLCSLVVDQSQESRTLSLLTPQYQSTSKTRMMSLGQTQNAGPSFTDQTLSSQIRHSQTTYTTRRQSIMARHPMANRYVEVQDKQSCRGKKCAWSMASSSLSAKSQPFCTASCPDAMTSNSHICDIQL